MLTDNEIIKTYDACVNGNLKCNECPFLDEVCDGKDCTDISWGYILSLINRQKAEIDELQHRNSKLEIELDDLKRDDLPRCKDALRRANEMGIALEKENEELREGIEKLGCDLAVARGLLSRVDSSLVSTRNNARAEAIKEFAER